jgi:hypothetical protein
MVAKMVVTMVVWMVVWMVVMMVVWMAVQKVVWMVGLSVDKSVVEMAARTVDLIICIKRIQLNCIAKRGCLMSASLFVWVVIRKGSEGEEGGY